MSTVGRRQLWPLCVALTACQAQSVVMPAETETRAVLVQSSVQNSVQGSVQNSVQNSVQGSLQNSVQGAAQSSDPARQELRGTLARMLNAPSVTVADDAFLHDSLLIIEKVRPRDAQGVQLSGRDFDRPEQFRLIKTGSACVLLRLRTGAREVLRHSRCEAVK